MLKTKNKFIKSTFCVVLFFLFIAVVSARPINLFKLNDNTLDIVQISDVHFDTKTKSNSKRMLEFSRDFLNDAISKVYDLTEAELVVFSGDIVNHSDKNEFLKFLNIANKLCIPWYYAPGNHDIGILGGLSKLDVTTLWLKNSKLLDRKNLCFDNQNSYYPANHPLFYSYTPKKNFLLLFLDGVIDNEITANGYFPKDELVWLENQLKNNLDKKVIIVQHFPVVEPFKSNSHVVRNADEYLKIIDKYSNVVAILSGHYHFAKITQRKNVLHISTPALVEYPNAFREIKITKMNTGTKFEIRLIETKTIETNLQYAQKISKSRSKKTTLDNGQEYDRNAVIIIKNPISQ